jgi:hypothetical protein
MLLMLLARHPEDEEQEVEVPGGASWCYMLLCSGHMTLWTASSD